MNRVLLVLVGFFALEVAQASSLPDYPFVFQSGIARTEVAPDVAFIHLTISSRGSDAAKVLDVVNASAAEIFKAL